jgi:hypothetical protein
MGMKNGSSFVRNELLDRDLISRALAVLCSIISLTDSLDFSDPFFSRVSESWRLSSKKASSLLGIRMSDFWGLMTTWALYPISDFSDWSRPFIPQLVNDCDSQGIL